ncbi:hypothetical protein PghCCS26_63220 [Paenibacillus glycanilyticus]|uniref:WD40 repeat domain-containing protein n=1 Tax=Paenibacillus glycanilyticus TaxID=126569 RepID=A0ABQ6NY31_9BACL|nr:WD40 repeat domain-containing protein [Paenibacillus glycanilyticus]GMK49192.1 hypothetical protein PghCCS26_63220 [Paenibacillus glycanilyticus]
MSKTRAGTIRKQIPLLAVSMMLLLALAGCIGDPASETIIIPENERSGMEVQVGDAFQVDKLYPLPVSGSPGMQVLGWTSGDSVVGEFSDRATSVATTLSNRIQLLALPYEKPQQLANAEGMGNGLLSLSPDGKRIAKVPSPNDGGFLTLVPLDEGPVQKIELPTRSLPSRHLAWSNNSRYISYLVAGDSREELHIVVCDTADGSAKEMRLLNAKTLSGGTAILPENGGTAVVSDDGGSVLIDNGKEVVAAKRNEDTDFEVLYYHPSGIGGTTWIDSDRFVFLGGDGTLFQYDIRNGELSVLLEKVQSFSLSRDRKIIAYALNDKETIYAGKLQGNNVLLQTTVYQGIVPVQMIWSLSNSSLLVDGNPPLNTTGPRTSASIPAEAEAWLQTFVIRFK